MTQPTGTPTEARVVVYCDAFYYTLNWTTKTAILDRQVPAEARSLSDRALDANDDGYFIGTDRRLHRRPPQTLTITGVAPERGTTFTIAAEVLCGTCGKTWHDGPCIR